MVAYTSVQAGFWDDILTWGAVGPPILGDTAQVNHLVIIRGNAAAGPDGGVIVDAINAHGTKESSVLVAAIGFTLTDIALSIKKDHIRDAEAVEALHELFNTFMEGVAIPAVIRREIEMEMKAAEERE